MADAAEPRADISSEKHPTSTTTQSTKKIPDGTADSRNGTSDLELTKDSPVGVLLRWKPAQHQRGSGRASRRPLRSGPAAPALMLSRLPSEEVVRRATLCQFEVALSISAACSTVRRRLGAAAAVQLNVEYSTLKT